MIVARDLLTESGSVFVQIGDENVHLVRCLMDEIFGAENFISQIQIRAVPLCLFTVILKREALKNLMENSMT